MPLLDKNAYDFDFPDLRRVQVLRGPQSVLFGRNTSLGVIRLENLSPFAWTGVRAAAEVASNGSWKGSVGTYNRPSAKLAWSASAAFSHDGGAFTNEYTGMRCDTGNALSLRGRVQWRPRPDWLFGNSLQAGFLREGGYAYGRWDAASATVLPVNYNDPSGYRRFHILDGLTARGELPWADLSAALGWQYLDDRMEMDNDFTPQSYFSMVQAQREHGLTAELILRKRADDGAWRWLAGGFLFGKWLRLSAPVTFQSDGIDALILANANRGIATAFPGEQEFLISSDFRIPSCGLALFGEAAWTSGPWTLTAGLRLETEYTAMRYVSAADIHYRFTLVMPEYDLLRTVFDGKERQGFFVPIPKFSVSYSLDKGLLYATVQRGHKAGGFNTQLFSDILQNRMMDNMMRDLGVSMGATRYDSAAATQYRPESTWNHELGAHLSPTRNLSLAAALFWIECVDRQVTVMAPGMGTGRMMSNAARSRSQGIELSADWQKGPWSFDVDYGYTRAVADGRRLPYAPENTLSAAASWRWDLKASWLDDVVFSTRLRGIGPIWWDEENTLRQPFYPLLSASVCLRRGALSFTLWGENLTDTAYQAFWFRSLQRDFFAAGRPLQFGLRINYNI